MFSRAQANSAASRLLAGLRPRARGGGKLDVTLVGINFAPEVTGIGRYMTAYANALHEAGRSVTVVTGQPHYPGWRTFAADDRAYPFRVERCAHYVPARPSASRRVLYELSFAVSVARKLRSLPRADVVLAVIPTLASAWVAARWASSLGAPFALVVQDLVSAAVEQSGTAGSVIGTATARIERSTIARATRIGIIHEAMRGALAQLGALDSAITLVPNWALQPEARYPSRAEARELLGFRGDEIVCAHTGNMGAKQGLEVIVEAARLADEGSGRVRFLLVGDGNQRTALERQARGIRSIEFWPLQPDDRFRAVLSGSDVLLLTQRANVEDMAHPSKLLEYQRAGTPIIGAVSPSSTAALALRDLPGAILVPPGDPHLLLRAVAEAERLHAHEGRLRKRTTAEDHEAGVRQFLEFVSAVADSRPPSATI